MTQSGRKSALITGITGQDGSYLAELLLAKGYVVHGVVRRSSSFNTDRIEHLYRDPHDPATRLFLHYGDLVDGTGLREILTRVQPDEVYNLGAQSHVRVSFDQPVYTVQSDALGTMNLLEAIRDTGKPVRFYQASSSEMYGKVRETPQTEQTPFYPRSPYACAKVYSYWQTVNYREAYNLFACNGILFNHECVTAETPVTILRNGLIEILPIEDVVPHRTNSRSGHKHTTVPATDELKVWDRGGWTAITCMTATWNGVTRAARKTVHRVAARGAVYHATGDHVVFVESAGEPAERRAAEVAVGDTLPLIDLPSPTDRISITADEAWLLGVLAAEGYVSEDGKLYVSNQDDSLLERVQSCWHRVTGGATSRYCAKSGFDGGSDVTQLRLTGAQGYGRYVGESLYTRSRHKRVPPRVLNAPAEQRLAFLRGYNEGDGLKSTPCTYEFQGFKTSSAALAAGLYWLASKTLGQRVTICLEERDGRLYYELNLNSPNTPGQKGQHLRRPSAEVVKACAIEYGGWLYDLATQSSTFSAGIGQGWIHNSPRRGETFVTRKITRAATRIKEGLQHKLYLGNLDAKRDWGFAGDYVEAMWLMLQQERPDDYVVATGETHSVRAFLDEVFCLLDLDWQKYVEVDPRYFRPSEVDLLLGDANKARRELGWQPKVTFKALAKMMTDADWELARRERVVADHAARK